MEYQDGWRRNKHGGLFNIFDVRMKKVTSKEFSVAVSKAKNSHSTLDKWRITASDAGHYDETESECYVSQNGDTVAVTSKGDIISVCTNLPSIKGRGSKLMQFAIEHGGDRLDSYAGNHRFYTKCGFEPVSWTPFNAQFADGWEESGCEPEHVIFYRYVGEGNVNPRYCGEFGLLNFYEDTKNTARFTGENGYEQAENYRDSVIKRKKG